MENLVSIGLIEAKRALIRPRYIFRSSTLNNKPSSISKYTLEVNERDSNNNVSSRYKILRGD